MRKHWDEEALYYNGVIIQYAMTRKDMFFLLWTLDYVFVILIDILIFGLYDLGLELNKI